MDAAMRASQIITSEPSSKGKIISFRKGTMQEQRTYVWSQIGEKTCVYVDWSGDISKYHHPPSMPYTVHIREQKHIHTLRIINQICRVLDVEFLVFDPFQSIQKQHMASLFCSISQLARQKNITAFLMLAQVQAPIIQAEVYIDPRRCNKTK